MEQAAVDQLGSVKYVVLGAYLLMLLAFGVAGYRKSQNTEEDYYLAGRGQGWIVSSLTIMATFFSSFALLGAPGMVYREGVIFALFSLNVPLSGASIYFLGARIGRIGRAKGYVTPADMICGYYGESKALRLLVALIGALYAVPYVIMQIKAGGILSESMFGEGAYVPGATILAVITMVYIMIGGMRSVAWTDVVQGLLLVGGMLLAGLATVAALGGFSAFFAAIAELPPSSLSAPGTTGKFNHWMLLTIVLFASTGSMIQPAQWMRYYAADSTNTLRRSALVFAVLLTACFLFGVMLVGLGGQALYPLAEAAGGGVAPNAAVGEYDNILVTVLTNHLPQLFGAGSMIGAIVTSLILVAIMAAAMSTADSNLHSLSGVVTRDVYDRYIRPEASQTERTWVGRIVICVSTVVALILVIAANARSPDDDPLKMIAQLGFFAIAFAALLLPPAIDIMYIRKGTRAGAISGIVAGLIILLFISPFLPSLLNPMFGEEALSGMNDLVKTMTGMVDRSAWGLLASITVFIGVSVYTRKPDEKTVSEFKRIAEGD
ncbi:MAG: SSS family solute:Na+ symporter [Candidatus Binatia bacterium]|jgi:SSS family solute:Na+ symporter